MLKATPEASVLISAKNGLVYLSANDWALLADKALRRQFKAGEMIVQRDRRTHGIFVLLKGAASVKIASQPAPLEIGPGEICGEISFLDELPATANVVAKEAVEAFYLERATLQSLFELFPHLPGGDLIAAVTRRDRSKGFERVSRNGQQELC